MPFLVLYWVFTEVRPRWSLITLGIGYCLLVLSLHASLHVGMLAPLEPTLWFIGWPLKLLMPEKAVFYQSVFHSVVAGCLLFISADVTSKHLKGVW